jgi:SAM-dependent methyltransferase
MMSAAAAVARLYNDVDGFGEVGVGPDGAALRRGRAHVYGELTTIGVRQLIRATGLAAGDRFFDLGSGTGRVVLQVAASLPGTRCVGIEVSGRRHEAARAVLSQALAKGLVARRQCTFLHQDLREANLARATVLFANSTCFPAELLRHLAEMISKLRRGTVFASLQELPSRSVRLFEPLGEHPCATSWDRKHTVHIYRTEGG